MNFSRLSQGVPNLEQNHVCATAMRPETCGIARRTPANLIGHNVFKQGIVRCTLRFPVYRSAHELKGIYIVAMLVGAKVASLSVAQTDGGDECRVFRV